MSLSVYFFQTECDNCDMFKCLPRSDTVDANITELGGRPVYKKFAIFDSA